jgi:DNA polymerase-3 subunit alpha (Gram-positive type)
MRKQNLVFIDIETTGPNCMRHEIIEIGAVITTPELKVIEKFGFKIKPTHIEDADLVALKVNKYSEKEWQDAEDLDKVMKLILKKAQGCIMVGHNVAFDAGFLDCTFNKLGLINTMHYHKIDTMSVAWAKLHREPDLDHFSLRELCLRFGITNKKAHSGLSDAYATFELYKKLMEL